MIDRASQYPRNQHRHHQKTRSVDVSFSEEDPTRYSDFDLNRFAQNRQVEEADRNASESSLRLRIDSIIELTRSASGLDLYFVLFPICNSLKLSKDTFTALQDKIRSLKSNTDVLFVKEETLSDPALGTDPWSFSHVSTPFGDTGLICLRNPAPSNTSNVLAHLRTALQQCIQDQNTLTKQALSQQLAIEIGRQAQNETLLDISAPGKSSRNLQQMGNVDLDVNIFANAADYLCRIIPAVQGCVIFDLTEFRMTMTSAQSRSHGSSQPGPKGARAESESGSGSASASASGADSEINTFPSETDDSSKGSHGGQVSSTSKGTSNARTSLPIRVKASSSKGSQSAFAEQSVASEGGKTHCSYLPTPTPIRILGFSGQFRQHFDQLSGTISKPIIAQHLSMSRSSGLNSKTFIEGANSNSRFNLSSIAPPNSKTFICSSVAEADAQPAYLIFAFSDQEELHFTQTEELFLEQLGAYLIYSSIRSRVVAVDRAQMRFTQRIQHELRTPLHAIIGVNEIAKQSLSHSFNLDEMSDLVESIGTSADTLSLLIDDMVDFSLMERLSGERRLMQTERVYSDWESICSVVTSTCLHGYQLSHRISRLDQKMKNHVVAPPEMFVFFPDLNNFNWKEYKAQVDLEIVRRMVWKLVMNAIQATIKGIICITVSRKSPKESTVAEAGVNTERLEIEISDTGKGMEQKFVEERLFQPFGKEDEESQGVGLSLSICQVLASQLSGRLSARSRLNVGTQMLISLPLRKTSKRESNERKSQEIMKVSVAFVGFESSDKRLFVDKFLTQFRIEESKNLSRAQIVIIAIDDPDLSSDCTKEIEIIKSRQSKAEVVLMPTLILRELDQARASRMDDLELALGQETKLLHRPMTVAEIQEFASIVRKLQTNRDEELASGVVDAFEGASNDLQHISINSKGVKSNSPSIKYMEIPRRSSASSDVPSMDHPYCILVVEDNPLNARIMTTMLKKAGFDYMLANDGQQGVEAFKKHLPHLVLLDINMPIMDGFEACKIMRSIISPYQHRIIAITALSTEAERRKGKESGMDEWLTKPTRMAPLLRNIRSEFHNCRDSMRTLKLIRRASFLAGWKKQYEGKDASNPSTPSSGGGTAFPVNS